MKKRAKIADVAKRYAIKRIVRKGELLASDIIRATGCSKPLATQIMADIIEEYPTATKKSGPKLCLIYTPHAWTEETNDAQLFAAINQGANEIDTGITTERKNGKDGELPIRFNRWSVGRVCDGLLTALISCFQQENLDHRASLKIEYVSMKLGDKAKWRRVVPIGLECVMEQWRLIAHDMDTPDYGVRTYVLARIIGHDVSVEPLPKKFKRASFDTIQSMVSVKLNPLLTPEQRKVMENELNIKADGRIQVENRMEFEFLRRFGNIPVTEGAIWPIVEQIGEKKCM